MSILRQVMLCAHRWRYMLLAVPAFSCGRGTTSPTPPAAVASVTVSPSHDTVLVAATVQLGVTLKDSAGHVLAGRSVSWSTSSGQLASVDSTGLVRALALGTVIVRAVSGGKADSATLVLAPRIMVSRDLPSLFKGDTTLLYAALTDALGAPLAGGPVTWESADSTVAAVNAAGVVNALAVGLVTITASFGGGHGEQIVAILQPSLHTNREIAFLRELQRPDNARIQTLWLMQPNGSGQTRISTDSEFVNDWDWSWDGSKLLIAYTNFNGVGRSGTFVVNADGSAEHQVTTTIGVSRWSPDGTKIAYNTNSHGILDIYTVNVDGSGLKQLTFDGLAAFAVWSPDGRQIAFRHLDASGAVGIMHADGTHLRIDTVTAPVTAISWSPDGKQLAVGTPAGEFLVSAGGTNPTPVCYPFGCAQAQDWPLWSPDKSHLALRDASGTHIVRVQDSTELLLPGAITPRWSPDGAVIAFVSPADTGPPLPWIRTVHQDGTVPMVLTGNDTTNTRLPIWRP